MLERNKVWFVFQRCSNVFWDIFVTTHNSCRTESVLIIKQCEKNARLIYFIVVYFLVLRNHSWNILIYIISGDRLKEICLAKTSEWKYTTHSEVFYHFLSMSCMVSVAIRIQRNFPPLVRSKFSMIYLLSRVETLQKFCAIQFQYNRVYELWNSITLALQNTFSSYKQPVGCSG